MKAARQVLHVAAKDLRLGKIFLLAYGFMVAVAASAWLAGFQRFIDWSFLWGLLTLLAAMFAAALLVVEDTPARGDLLWSTLPLSATAVLGAKLLVVLAAVIAPTLAAQAVVLAFLDVGSSDVLRSLSVSFAVMVVTLLFAMVLGSVSRDARLVTVLLTVVPLAILIAGNIIWYLVWGATETEPGYSSAFGPALLLLALLVHQYRTRRTRRTVLLLVLALLTTVLWPAKGAPEQRVALSSPPAEGPRVRVATIDTASVLRNGFVVVLELDGGDHRLRYDIRSLSAHLVDAAGRRDSVELSAPQVLLQHGLIPGLQDLNNLTAVPRRWPPAAHITMSDMQRTAFTTGEAQLELSGVLIARVADRWGAIPLSSREVASAEGRRLRVTGWQDGAQGAEIDLELLEFGTFQDARLAVYDRASMDPLPRYLLTNDERNEYVVYLDAESTGTSPMVIVPGPRSFGGRIRLRRANWTAREAESLDAAWMAGAELLVVDWEIVSSQPVRLRASMRLSQ